MRLENKKALVMGMRASGISACNLLKKLKAKVICYDDYINPLENEFENCKGQSLENILNKVSLIVVSPAIPNNHIVLERAKEKRIPIISELELGCKYVKAPIICVTGTNGKTTVVGMLEKILTNLGLKVKAMGNIGYPVSQVAFDGQNLDYAIVEASSFQLEYVQKLHPYISVITNLAPDHLERHKSFKKYIQIKSNILRNQQKSDYVILNFDDKNVKLLNGKCKGNIIAINLEKKSSPVYVKDKYYFFGDIELCNTRESRAKGVHNIYNLLMALNVGAILGCRREHMLNLIKNYTPLPHRIEYVTTRYQKNFYNDSKGTNIHACRYAISCLEGNIGLIMGGSDKNEDYCEFFENIDDKVKVIAVTGDNAEKIYNSAMKMGFNNITVEDTLKLCVERLAQDNIIKNILFSPCAASFDRYTDYIMRGETYKDIVYEINL